MTFPLVSMQHSRGAVETAQPSHAPFLPLPQPLPEAGECLTQRSITCVSLQHGCHDPINDVLSARKNGIDRFINYLMGIQNRFLKELQLATHTLQIFPNVSMTHLPEELTIACSETMFIQSKDAHAKLLALDAKLVAIEQAIFSRHWEILQLEKMEKTSSSDLSQLQQLLTSYKYYAEQWVASVHGIAVEQEIDPPPFTSEMMPNQAAWCKLEAEAYAIRHQSLRYRVMQIDWWVRLLAIVENKVFDALQQKIKVKMDDFKTILDNHSLPIESVIARMQARERATLLPIFCEVFADKSDRQYMEDTLCICTDQAYPGLLVGVFDGHQSDRVSLWAKENLSRCFATQYGQGCDDIQAVLQRTLDALHTSCKKEHRRPPIGGSTAVICYYDPKTAMCYIATLGDSGAEMWIDGKWLPLSKMQNWSMPEEASRADRIPGVKWQGTNSGKHRRLDWKGHCINVSRAIGNFPLETALSRQAEMTQIPCFAGDLMVIGTDGLFDTPHPDLSAQKAIIDSREHVAEKLGRQAMQFQKKRKGDNVTAVVLYFGGEPPKSATTAWQP